MKAARRAPVSAGADACSEGEATGSVMSHHSFRREARIASDRQSSSTWWAGAAAPSLRPVGSIVPHLEGRRDALVGEMHDKSVGRVLEIVTMIQPNPRVVSQERHVVALPRRNIQCVRPPRATRGHLAIATQDRKSVV